jgi:hypothetical protein
MSLQLLGGLAMVLTLALSLVFALGAMGLAGSISEKIHPPDGGFFSYLVGMAVTFPLFFVLTWLMFRADNLLLGAK